MLRHLIVLGCYLLGVLEALVCVGIASRHSQGTGHRWT